jgi:RNA polymerase sigma-70 factor (ECF subfamily)
MTGDRHLADDLLQETYYRFLRAKTSHVDDTHRRHYLFRIATNLLKDSRRRHRVLHVTLPDEEGPFALASSGDEAAQAETRADLARAMARLKPRERSMLWLAYAQGASHREIAEVLGVKTASMKLLLFRARHRLARLLRGQGSASANVRVTGGSKT